MTNPTEAIDAFAVFHHAIRFDMTTIVDVNIAPRRPKTDVIEGAICRCRRPVSIAAAGILAFLIAVMPTWSVQTVAADELRFIDDAADAMATSLHLIDQAQAEIVVSSYVVDTGWAAAAMLRHLESASRRGVHVRLAYDAFQTPLPDAWARRLIANGIEVRIFNPPDLTRPLALNWRLHAKLVIADRNRGVLGSRNWQDSHFDVDRDKTFVDQDIELSGNVARQAAEYFDQIWTNDRLVVQTGRIKDRPRIRADQWNREEFDIADLPAAELDRRANAMSAATHCRSARCPSNPCQLTAIDDQSHLVDNVALLFDQCVDKRRQNFAKTVIGLIDQSKHRVILETPYPSFSTRMMNALAAASRRGAAVTILTNSFATTDQDNVYASYQNKKGRLLRAGIELREVTGDQTLHCKTLLIDQCTAIVGSYNFDSRSEDLNVEVGLLIHDQSFAAALNRRVHGRMREAIKIESRPMRPLRFGPEHSLRDHAELWYRRFLVLGFDDWL